MHIRMLIAALPLIAAAAGAATPLPPTPVAGDMVLVPAGRFFMGCNEKVDTTCFDNERPGHDVEVAAFKIDRTEVTVAQYKRCVAADKCATTGLTVPYWKDAEKPEWAQICNWDKPGREQHPINCLDWAQAKAYCEWAGKRLPTEAEWEKAARGTDGRVYPWGNEGFTKGKPVANIADESAKREHPKWSVAPGYDDGHAGTAPVGSFPAGASPYGGLDMTGNVWEWTADELNGGRVVRGGCWSAPPYVRASTRTFYDPRWRYERVGVRCAR